MTREMTCIVCPKGCQLQVRFGEKGEIDQITGFTCPRGKQYAIDECTHPVRTLTTTVRCTDGGVVAVKTNRPIPKEFMLACMKELRSVTVTPPLHIGDTVISGLLGTDADLIIAANRE